MPKQNRESSPLADAGAGRRPAESIAGRLREVRRRIAVAAEDAGRNPRSVTLICVTKGHSRDAIAAAIAAGERVFGENRVQEAKAKWPPLKAAHADLELHLIGPLQTNKTREAVELFDVIETLDRPRLAQSLAREMERSARRPRLYVEVNTGEEPQKSGVLPSQADAFIAACRGDYGLEIEGLMCIPPDGQLASPHFALLAKIAQRNGIAKLSMGMSADFELAIPLGATHVRIGTALFGARG